MNLDGKRYTTAEAANFLGIQPKTLLNKSSAREIAYISGRPNQYPESALNDYLKRKTKKSIF